MSDEDRQVDRPTPAAAAAALDELAAARRAVSAAERRTLPLVLGASSFLTLVQHAARDHLPDRRTQWIVAGTCVALDVLLQAGDIGSTAVRPFGMGPGEHPALPTAPRAVQAVGALARASVEWSVAAALRRSRLPWPNTAAGAVLAVGTLLANLAVRRVLARPGPHA